MSNTPVDGQTKVLAAIGNICLQWSLLEFQALYILSAIEGERAPTTFLKYGGLDMFPRLNMCINLAHHTGVRHPVTQLGKELLSMVLPEGEATPLIRTDFSNDDIWSQVVEAATATSADGFQAHLQIVDDSAFDGADPERLAELAETTTEHVLLVIADRLTMADPERSLLCIDPLPPGGTFRTVPEHLWGVENNVSLANMDFSDFASAKDADGVFRGFRD